MNKTMLTAVVVASGLAVGLMGYAAVAAVNQRGENAARTVSTTRPEGADVYIELDAQTGNHPWTFTSAGESMMRVEVTVGQTVAIGLTNTDKQPHDIVFGGAYGGVRTPVLKNGGTAWVTFKADRETPSTPFWCSVPGHRQSGMHGVLVVKGANRE